MKNLFKNEQFQLDEIVFQGKNKAYGAYALRAESDKILTRALFVGIAFFGAIITTPILLNAFKITSNIDRSMPEDLPPFEILNVDLDKQKVIIAAPEKVKEIVATVNTVVPTPTINPVKQDPPATVEESKEAVRGFETVVGEPADSYVQPTITSPNVGTEPNNVVVTPPVNDNALHTFVDVEASFNGGINVFRNKVASNFDTSNFDGSGEKMSATISFIVERDGSISQIKASGGDIQFNKEAEKTIRNVKGKWTPAKVNGKPVRSYFKFPISMTFQ